MKDLDIKKFVDEAITEAEKAFLEDEVPVGAVLIRNGEIIGKAHNTTKKNHNRLAHAEMILINDLIEKEHKEILDDFSLVVTLEPCAMCFSACNLVRLKEVVFVLNDENFGYSKSLQNLNIFSKSLQNLNILKTNYRENDVKALMQNFFKKHR